MDRVDEFESLFRSADKPQFEYRELQIERVALVTDLDAAGTAELERAVRSFLEPLPGIADATLACIAGDDFDNADTLLGKLGDVGADFVVSYRNVKGSDRSGRSTLGSYIHILSQETAVPLLLLPDPDSPQFRERLASDGPVMVMTEALTGDSTLINSGLLFCREGGSLYLSHIESGPIFERYVRPHTKSGPRPRIRMSTTDL